MIELHRSADPSGRIAVRSGMRSALFSLSLLAFAMPTLAQQQTLQSATIPLQTAYDPQACFGWDAGTGEAVITLATFTDPLPPGSLVRSASVTWPIGNDKQFSFQLIPTITLFINGTTGTQLGAPQTIWNYDGCTPSSATPYVFPSQDFTQGFPTYVYGGQNTLTMDEVTGNVHPAGPAVLTLTYVPPNPFEFSITNAAPEADRRVLLSNLHAGYTYPHFQELGAQDSAVPMFVRARGQNGQFQAGLTVYLRIYDPPDSAPYATLNPNAGLSHIGDNVGQATLDGLPQVPSTNYYQAVSNTNGEIDFIIRLQPGTAAGDNFQVEASFDPSFPAGATSRSGTVTAWKRIFVEKKRMLRNGINMTSVSLPGVATISVADNHCGGNFGTHHRIARGDHLIMVHAPAIDGHDALAGQYFEEHDVADVVRDATNGFVITLGTRSGNTVNPELLQHAFGPDTSPGAGPMLADHVACLSGLTISASDYFEATDDLVSGADNPFASAFVEYIILPDNTPRLIPVPNIATDVEQDLQLFADKWSNSGAGTMSAPNHQMLIIADRDSATTTSPQSGTGLTLSQVPGEQSSWVWRGWIEWEVSNQGMFPRGDANAWASKTEAHELAHEWRPNVAFGNGDHCPTQTPSYNDPTVYCLLSNIDSGTAVLAQRMNGIARFHLLQLPDGSWHSEYFAIRRHADPFLP